MYAIPASSCDASGGLTQGLNPTVSNKLQQQGIIVTGCNSVNWTETFPMLNTGPVLLAAIDPDAENQLVHLNKYITNGRALTEKDTIQKKSVSYPNLRIDDVPLIFNQNTPQALRLSVIRVRVADVTGANTASWQRVNNGQIVRVTNPLLSDCYTNDYPCASDMG
jgi:hypothetical protein